jgi:integrase
LLHRIFETYADPLGNFPYNQITKSDAITLRGRLANYDMPNSMKNEFMKAIRAVYTFWDYDETITFNPFKKTSSFNDFTKTTKDNRDVFSDTELRAIFDFEVLEKAYPDDSKWQKFLQSDYFKSFLFCGLTGLRSSEARALIPSQIMNNRILTVDRAFKEKNVKVSSIGKPKRDKIRVIVLCDSAYEIIKDALEQNKPDEYIFKNDTGNNAIENSRWNKMFVYFMDMMRNIYEPVFNDRYFTPHCLRKTLNTLLVNKYHCNNELVLDYLGWGENGTKSSLSKVQKEHYTITKAEDMLVVAQIIEKMYSGNEMYWFQILKSEDNKTDTRLETIKNRILSGMKDG